MHWSWRMLGLQPGRVCGGWLFFDCNICGGSNAVRLAKLGREGPPCRGCGATVRQRALAHLLMRHIFARDDMRLPELDSFKAFHGIGMSDWDGLAKALARPFQYTNTFYHQEPRLDITNIPEAWEGTLDFVISSDVLEHVAPPVSRAFVNVRRLLRPLGVFVLTVPWVPEGETLEHFPELHDYQLENAGTPAAVLRNRTRDGRRQEFRNLVFHGGDGATLEMRLFSRAGLLRELEQAGFVEITFHDQPVLASGIHWAEPWSLPITALASDDGRPIEPQPRPLA
jgi:SAM-dependent methyltransferase